MTQKRIAQHASFSLHNLFTIFNQLSLNTSDKCKLFDCLVGSVLNYNAAVWGTHPAKDIESIHTNICRKNIRSKTLNQYRLFVWRARTHTNVHYKTNTYDKILDKNTEDQQKHSSI
jgi:hypothetical protein